MRNPIIIVLAGALLAGCAAERDPAFNRPRLITGPVPLKEQVAYVDGALDRVVLVDLAEARPRVAAVSVGRRPIWASPTLDRDRLLVIPDRLHVLHARMVGRFVSDHRRFGADLLHQAARQNMILIGVDGGQGGVDQLELERGGTAVEDEDDHGMDLCKLPLGKERA